MGIPELAILFGVMVALAAMPSTSVALVVTRSATAGVDHGVAVSAGIVVGDLVFVLLAVLGLAVVAEGLGELFVVVKVLGAGYLLWLGASLLRGKPEEPSSGSAGTPGGSLAVSFLAGFLLTLGDIKAVFFYVSLFPMFVDGAALEGANVAAVVLVTVAAVGGVKTAYALSAARVASLSKGFRFAGVARRAAGAFMVGAGGYILAKA